MKQIVINLAICFLPFLVAAQENCNVFLWQGDTAKFNACELIQKSPKYFQLTYRHHKIRDSAIQIAPHYDYPYWSKSIAFLKTGDFVGWKQLIDKAVNRNELKHLGYRGWCRFQFFGDYRGAIADLDRLEAIMGTSDIGVSQNGTYHLQIAKALCHKMIGERTEALSLIEDQIAADPDFVGAFDFMHLGVLYLETGDLDKAHQSFLKQEKMNPIAENCFYQSKLEMVRGNLELALNYAKEASKRYKDGQFMYDPYSHQVDKVYAVEMEELIDHLKSLL
ncbi:MAG: hypothetical protein AAF789_02055 [Bacteroidota bacterium]